MYLKRVDSVVQIMLLLINDRIWTVPEFRIKHTHAHTQILKYEHICSILSFKTCIIII